MACSISLGMTFEKDHQTISDYMLTAVNFMVIACALGLALRMLREDKED